MLIDPIIKDKLDVAIKAIIDFPWTPQHPCWLIGVYVYEGKIIRSKGTIIVVTETDLDLPDGFPEMILFRYYIHDTTGTYTYLESDFSPNKIDYDWINFEDYNCGDTDE